MSKLKVLYPGSFDPISNGHIDLARRGLKIFGKLAIVIARNTDKTALFTVDERIEMVREVFRKEPAISVDSYSGMTVDYARSIGANAILRGIRTVSDFEYEYQMALTNRHFDQDIESIFMMTSDQFAFISSHFIKEAVALGGDISAFVPPRVEKRLREKLKL